VYLIEPTAYVGGMMYAGGIGLRDLNNVTVIANTVAEEVLADLHAPVHTHDHTHTQYLFMLFHMQWMLTNAKAYGKTTPVHQPDMEIGRMSIMQMLTKYNIHIVFVTSINEQGEVFL
jgi:hypothetical protein